MPFWFWNKPTRAPFGSEFNLVPLTYANQDNTTEAVLIIPPDAFYQLLHVSFDYSLGIGPPTNHHVLNITRGGRTLFRHTGDQGSGGGKNIQWTVGVDTITVATANGRPTYPLCSAIYLYPDDHIILTTTQLNGGENWRNIRVTCKEWPTKETTR